MFSTWNLKQLISTKCLIHLRLTFDNYFLKITWHNFEMDKTGKKIVLWKMQNFSQGENILGYLRKNFLFSLFISLWQSWDVKLATLCSVKILNKGRINCFCLTAQWLCEEEDEILKLGRTRTMRSLSCLAKFKCSDRPSIEAITVLCTLRWEEAEVSGALNCDVFSSRLNWPSITHFGDGLTYSQANASYYDPLVLAILGFDLQSD